MFTPILYIDNFKTHTSIESNLDPKGLSYIGPHLHGLKIVSPWSFCFLNVTHMLMDFKGVRTPIITYFVPVLRFERRIIVAYDKYKRQRACFNEGQ